MACVMLHNTIIEDEHNQNLESRFDVNENIQFKWGLWFEEYVKGNSQIKNKGLVISFKMIS